MNVATAVITITIVLSVILAIVSFWLPQMTPDHEKLSPYECGFDPLGLAYTEKYTEKSKYTWLILTSIQKGLSILGLYWQVYRKV